ncbi:MAG: TetR/AcrR family transcriptional regulator [Solirubrobacteraceae bacterium]|nr:TetR/AcrR family transcriptional regulator [Solirubrobacteraceae bacterium]
MPSVTRRPAGGRDRRDAIAGRVRDAVERLLVAGESFTALPVGRIADEAGIGRSTFYGHFPDKVALLIALTESATATLFDRAARWVDEDGTRDELDAVVLHHVTEYRAHAPLLRAVVEVAGYEPDVDGFWQERIVEFAASIRRRIERDQAAGAAHRSIDAGPAAEWIAWGTERAVSMHVATRPPAEDAAFARGVAGATWAAMGRLPES